MLARPLIVARRAMHTLDSRAPTMLAALAVGAVLRQPPAAPRPGAAELPLVVGYSSNSMVLPAGRPAHAEAKGMVDAEYALYAEDVEAE